MIAVAFAADLLEVPGALTVRRELSVLGVPVSAEAELLRLPPSCVWYITRTDDDALAARLQGRNVVLVDSLHATPEPDERGIYHVARTEDALGVLSGPCTQAVLELRYLFRTVLGWGTAPTEN